jgi:hypothetical protein
MALFFLSSSRSDPDAIAVASSAVTDAIAVTSSAVTDGCINLRQLQVVTCNGSRRRWQSITGSLGRYLTV